MGVCSILLFATSAAAATSTPLPLLKLRGGEVKPLRYGMETGKYTARPAVKPQKIVNIDPMEVGDTEKVYVLQQFEKPEVRLAFMRKVYSIVTAQLAVTALIVYVLRNVPGLLPGLVQKLGTAIGLLPLIPLTLLAVIPGVRGSGSNLAYLLLAIFTVLEGLAVGAFTWFLPTSLILRAAGATTVATGGLTLYALTTKRDFTMLGGMLYSCLLGLLALGIMQYFVGGNLLQSGRAALGTFVFCGYLIVNTQMMMGGNKAKQLRPNEHIMAAITLYTDILNLFLHILAAMARSERD